MPRKNLQNNLTSQKLQKNKIDKQHIRDHFLMVSFYFKQLPTEGRLALTFQLRF